MRQTSLGIGLQSWLKENFVVLALLSSLRASKYMHCLLLCAVYYQAFEMAPFDGTLNAVHHMHECISILLAGLTFNS